MVLKTKCVKFPIEPSDGIRISIMSRHTLDDGITPDPEINFAMFSGWMPILGPPLKLVGAYYRQEMNWFEFERHYQEHLTTERVEGVLKSVIKIAKSTTITFLCIEESPDHCHRRLLAEGMAKIDPGLIVFI